MKTCRRLFNSAALLAIATAAAGCGHGGGGDGGLAMGGGASRPISYADTDGTAATALSNGKSLETTGFTSSARDGKGPIDSTFAIKKNDKGAVDVTVNGDTYSFKAADKNGTVWENQTANKDDTLVTQTYADADQAINPSAGDARYSQAWLYFLKDSNDKYFNGYAVVGTEAKADDLKGMATASYEGNMVARFRETDGSNMETEVRTDNANGGKLSMTADFGGATISGQADGFVKRTRTVGGAFGGDTAVNGNVVLEPTKIDGNSYKGNLTGTGDFKAGLQGEGTYSGRFFGPNAEETAGTIGYSGDPDTTGTGFFQASKQP